MTSDDDGQYQVAVNILLCGGIAGVVTWGSVFPLDMIKTRLQAQTLGHSRGTEGQSLLQQRQTLNSFQIAKETYRAEGIKAFYRGLRVCSVRAFIVNAVQVCFLWVIVVDHKLRFEQWAAYEWLMKSFSQWGTQVKLQEPTVGL